MYFPRSSIQVWTHLSLSVSLSHSISLSLSLSLSGSGGGFVEGCAPLFFSRALLFLISPVDGGAAAERPASVCVRSSADVPGACHCFTVGNCSRAITASFVEFSTFHVTEVPADSDRLFLRQRHRSIRTSARFGSVLLSWSSSVQPVWTHTLSSDNLNNSR